MGASPVLNPTKVAYMFTNLYYKVAASIPHQLPSLYGENSVLRHEALIASGTDEITGAAHKLPISGNKAALFSLDVQKTGSGFVVLVVGALPGNRMFSQTFVLEHPDGSHPQHLYCRNDLFRFMPNDLEAARVAFGKVAEEHTQDWEDYLKAINDGAKSPPPTCTDISPETSSPASVVVVTPKKPSTPESSPVSDVSVPNVNSVAPDVVVVKSPGSKPASRKNSPRASKKAAPPKEPAETAIPRSVVTKKEASKSAANRPAPRAKQVATAPAKPATELPVEKVASPPVPKTWASIVSTQKAAANITAPLQPAGQASPIPTQGEVMNSSAPVSPPVNPVVAQPANKAPHARQGKQPSSKGGAQGKAGKNLGTVNAAKASVPVAPVGNAPPTGSLPNTNQAPNYGSHNNNHSQYHHHNNNGHDQQYKGPGRVFGPSAVVQLSSMGDHAHNAKELVHLFKEEFGQYGHRVRHVEVKLGKGLAFIEYDTAEGVHAAVAAWASGARADGKFAGVPLSVSEKRTSYMRRPGSMRGGGRGGGMRGRRGRPTSSPAS